MEKAVTMKSRWMVAVATVCLVMCLAVGCSETVQRVPVAGTVVVDGQPLTEGTIRLIPEHGRPVFSTIMHDGSFQLGESSVGDKGGTDGVLPGKYQIAVSASQILNEEKDKVKWLAPSHYADHRSSGLEVVIKEAKDDLLVELTWEGAETEEDPAEAEDGAPEDGEVKDDTIEVETADADVELQEDAGNDETADQPEEKSLDSE